MLADISYLDVPRTGENNITKAREWLWTISSVSEGIVVALFPTALAAQGQTRQTFSRAVKEGHLRMHELYIWASSMRDLSLR
jgi:BarA-like signal transduction histidine kinase